MGVYDKTICGIDLSAFAKQPSPSEVGAIVARWNDKQQAEFFMWFGSKLHDSAGFRDEQQCRSIGVAIEKLETELLDGSATRVIRMIADGLAKAGAA